MVIENINCSTKNTMSMLKNSANNVNKQQSLKVLNSNKIATISKTDICHQKSTDFMKQKMKHLIDKLRISQSSEFQAQRGMSFLQQKDICLDKVRGAGDKLKELSEQYKSSDLSEEDKVKLEKQAEKLLKGIDNLMNNNNSVYHGTIDYKSIPITSSDVETSIVLSKSFNITLEPGKLDDPKLSNAEKIDIPSDKHFKSNVSTKVLLDNTSIIEERILKPVEKAIEDVDSAKSEIYHKFTDAYGSATDSIKELFKSGEISIYKSNQEMKFQQSLYSAISSLRFQSSNINKDNAYELLKEI